MPARTYHICVCVCTFKRVIYLKHCLEALSHLNTGGLFSYSIVVADNDREQSAERAVRDFARESAIATTYCVEPEQNIALVRNKVLELAKGDYIACIDDDEFPAKDWLLNALQACRRLEVDGVLGPVRASYEFEPPRWVIRGRFCERPTHETGLVLHWRQTTTANVLFRSEIVKGMVEPFRREFGSGCEDNDFFKRLMEKGRVFAWCQEAVVHEFVPSARWQRRYLLKRALLRGQNNRHFADVHSIVKSVIAVPIYTVLLPVLPAFGHHMLMKYLVKLCDHGGKLLGLIGFRPMGEKYLAG